MAHLRPVENLKPELKEYCRDQILLQTPKIYERLMELEQQAQTIEQGQNKSQSKFSKIKSFFKHGLEKSL